MAVSRRWKSLERQIETLRVHLLPRVFDPLGNYPRPLQVRARARAFVVLSHAEIESYMEDCAKDVARTCEDLWNTSARITRPLAFLIATLSERVAISTSITGTALPDTPRKVEDACKRLFQQYYKRIKDNNGIKEHNTLLLFSPLGVPFSAYGPTLLPNLDSFGALRGQHAHESARAVTSVVDPETEYQRVRALVSDLKPFDEWLAAYRRKIR